MSFKDRVQNWVVQLFFEGPARRMGLAKVIQKLSESGEALKLRFASLGAKESNLKALRHIIAIERWGQSRLRVGLGEAFKQDESSAYQPAADLSLEELQEMFVKTRGETLAIAGELDQRKVDPTMTVPHNQFGPLTLLAWLRYLTTHAALEAKRTRA